MSATAVISPNDEAQLAQTIEMFEVITQSQPQDYQSLEILKEAYSKLGREKDVISTSKRIAQAYVQLGQLSSAILEYETILQRAPDEAEVQAALAEIESKAGHFPAQARIIEPAQPKPATATPKAPQKATQPADQSPRKLVADQIDDGRKGMHRIFVESKVITLADFNAYWPVPDLTAPPKAVVEPLIQVLADKGVHPLEKSLKLLCDKTRAAFLPLDKYDIDLDLARSFAAETCLRWCVLPFDRMSKSTLVATANPFNHQAAEELAEMTTNRLVWYVAQPVELIKNLRKAFRLQ